MGVGEGGKGGLVLKDGVFEMGVWKVVVVVMRGSSVEVKEGLLFC